MHASQEAASTSNVHCGMLQNSLLTMPFIRTDASKREETKASTTKAECFKQKYHSSFSTSLFLVLYIITVHLIFPLRLLVNTTLYFIPGNIFVRIFSFFY